MKPVKTLPQRKRIYRKLRARLTEQGIGQGEVARLLGISPSLCSRMFTGLRPWDCRMMYQLMEYLNLPYDQLHVYFPPNPLWQQGPMGR